MGDLEKRMKTYEQVSKTYLMNRCPVIIRLDGKNFSNFTKGFEKPFDEILGKAMHQTMFRLCKEIPGCEFGYTQSDEITLVLCDYQTLERTAWFKNNVQKLCSISASKATNFFNEELMKSANTLLMSDDEDKKEKGKMILEKKVFHADFDARAFNLPINEVANNLYWRQSDGTRNSIEGTGRAYFTTKELHKKNTSEIQDMLMNEKGINWNDLDTWKKRGCCAVKVMDITKGKEVWKLDMEIPIFTKNWDYINKRITF